jgi:hypothetical protein
MDKNQHYKYGQLKKGSVFLFSTCLQPFEKVIKQKVLFILHEGDDAILIYRHVTENKFKQKCKSLWLHKKDNKYSRSLGWGRDVFLHKPNKHWIAEVLKKNPKYSKHDEVLHKLRCTHPTIIPLDVFNFKPLIFNRLRSYCQTASKPYTVQTLLELSTAELLNIKGLGVNSIEEIDYILEYFKKRSEL